MVRCGVSRRLRRSAQADFLAIMPTKCPVIGVPGARAKVDSACSFGGLQTVVGLVGMLDRAGNEQPKSDVVKTRNGFALFQLCCLEYPSLKLIC